VNSVELTLPPGAVGADVAAPRRARREVRVFLTDQGLGDRVEDVLLVISELVSNSVLHARAAPELVLRVCSAAESRAAESLVVEVRDPSPALPVERAPDLTARGGRGMRLVSALADKWGVEVRGAAGKTIWAEFLSPARG
jgi:two-component sensor histidine kinase